MRLTEEQYAVQQAREWRKGPRFESVDAVGSQRPVVPLEKDIQREIREALTCHPAVLRVWRVNSGAHLIDTGESARRFVRYHDIPGMADLWIWLKRPHAPRQAFIEVKRPGEVATDKQAAFLEAVTALGHVGFVASNAADAFERLTTELSSEKAA